MKSQTILTIAISLITFTILIWTGIIMLTKTQNQFLDFCAEKDWKGVYNISGDFSGEIDCKAMWEDNFANRKWAKSCSSSPFSVLFDCQWLCIQDCKLKNKQGGELRCVC